MAPRAWYPRVSIDFISKGCHLAAHYSKLKIVLVRLTAQETYRIPEKEGMIMAWSHVNANSTTKTQ